MNGTGADANTGEIFLTENSTPIGPATLLDNFLPAFARLDAFRTDVAQNPYPTVGFGRAFLIGQQHFTVSGQFGDSRVTD